MAMKIIKGYPPNYAALCTRFPIKGRPNVIFSYGGIIYSPSTGFLPPAIIAHEEFHGERQRLMGVEAWWEKYCEDHTFMFTEELLAYRVEWDRFKNGPPFPSRSAMDRVLRGIAERLSGPIYLNAVSYEDAMKLLTCEDVSTIENEQGIHHFAI